MLPIYSTVGKNFLDAIMTVSYNSTLFMPSRHSAATLEEIGNEQPIPRRVSGGG
jgi:hypothetical protein